MLFHELRGLPVDQFALGAGGATLGFGGFDGHFFELLLRIDEGFSVMQGLWRRGRGLLEMIERPFQCAMYDEVGIAANSRRRGRVLRIRELCGHRAFRALDATQESRGSANSARQSDWRRA